MENSPRGVPTYRGKYIGVVALVAAQLLVGFIHAVFGLWILSSMHIEPFGDIVGSSSGFGIYGVYTTAFGFLTLLFAAGLWLQKRWSWVGTVAVAVFVIAADSLTLLNLPSIPAIPKFAGFGEITYSILVLLYLSQWHVRAKYRIVT
jgi:hypothetical protein